MDKFIADAPDAIFDLLSQANAESAARIRELVADTVSAEVNPEPPEALNTEAPEANAPNVAGSDEAPNSQYSGFDANASNVAGSDVDSGAVGPPGPVESPEHSGINNGAADPPGHDESPEGVEALHEDFEALQRKLDVCLFFQKFYFLIWFFESSIFFQKFYFLIWFFGSSIYFCFLQALLQLAESRGAEALQEELETLQRRLHVRLFFH